MNQASIEQVKLKAASSSKYAAKLFKTYKYFLNEVVEDENAEEAFNLFAMRCLKVNTATATCSSKSDERMIRGLIIEEGGFELLDGIIFNIRKKLINRIMKWSGADNPLVPVPTVHSRGR
eukprot:TRINITY_DN16212_c0_g1_i2.p2 TRINITY_DN16212_c0_g1~~TRINITY_DN16212_c0_g1_i2.p2  ORF type:complete len:120 (-),score=34.31 TRINITY_DN16212_c0_g1_i2:82-441(-)